MSGRVLKGEACLLEGLTFLIEVEPKFEIAYEATRKLRLDRAEEGFSTLLWAIVGQQVSVASAEAVWARLNAADLVTPDRVLVASDEEFRAQGMSRQKIKYARALAESGIDYSALRGVSDVDVRAQLTSVTGIGRWTAEIYLMFTLLRADVIAAGDLAMQEAARELFELPKRPSEKELRKRAEPWAPWRAVAGRLLWDYYLRDRSKETSDDTSP